MARPAYDYDDVRVPGPRPQIRGGWGLLAAQIYGMGVVPATKGFTKRAACTEIDPELFFPEAGQASQSQAARRICNACPARAECRELVRLEDFGIWGGGTEATRKKNHARTGKMFP